jgi:hypothetical protein
MKIANSQDQQPKPAGSSWSGTAEELAQSEVNPRPSTDEVARAASFRYLNEGSPTGRDMQHWLEAEAHLMAEIIRVHGFANWT